MKNYPVKYLAFNFIEGYCTFCCCFCCIKCYQQTLFGIAPLTNSPPSSIALRAQPEFRFHMTRLVCSDVKSSECRLTKINPEINHRTMQFKIIWLLTGRWLDSIIISCVLSAFESTLVWVFFTARCKRLESRGKEKKDRTIKNRKEKRNDKSLYRYHWATS